MTSLLHRPDPVPAATVQGTLALDLTPCYDPPALPGRHPGRPGGDVVPIEVAQRHRIEAWAYRYAQAVVEIVAGDRPASQLVRWTAPGVHADLARRAQLVARAGGHVPGQGRAGQVVRPQVQGVRSCFVTARRVEVSIHVRHGERSRAIAARFELVDGRWLCTALEFA
jgi:Family of unknown function (DUF6459)